MLVEKHASQSAATLTVWVAIIIKSARMNWLVLISVLLCTAA